jgi:hypothetical protein
MVTWRGCTAQRCSSASETTTGSKRRISRWERGTGLGGVVVNLDEAEAAFRGGPLPEQQSRARIIVKPL